MKCHQLFETLLTTTKVLPRRLGSFKKKVNPYLACLETLPRDASSRRSGSLQSQLISLKARDHRDPYAEMWIRPLAGWIEFIQVKHVISIAQFQFKSNVRINTLFAARSESHCSTNQRRFACNFNPTRRSYVNGRIWWRLLNPPAHNFSWY